MEFVINFQPGERRVCIHLPGVVCGWRHSKLSAMPLKPVDHTV